MSKSWIWKSVVAGLCGSMAHSVLMLLKSWMGWLPSFQPYENLQAALSQLTGTDLPPFVPWVLSFLNGATVLGFLFARTYRFFPGRNGATKGLVFGLLGWAMMGLVFFPLLGLGMFAAGIGLGVAPALFSLAMILTYGIVLGMVYAALNR